MEASAPSVSHCPTSIPQPLALILSPPHAGQRQKQSRNNPSVPPAEPRPHTRNGPRHSAMSIAPARPWGLQGSSPGIPTALGASLAAGALSSAPGCRVWGSSSPGIHRHTFCQPHRCPTPVSQGTVQGSRDMQGVLGNDGGSLPASGSAQQKLLPELARDVLGEEIQPVNLISSD